MVQPQPLVGFASFSYEKYSTKYDYIKAWIVCLGFEPGITGW